MMMPTLQTDMDAVFGSLAKGIAFIEAGHAQRVGVRSKWVAWRDDDGTVRHKKMHGFEPGDE